jgi:hypothetical protein
MSTPGPSRRSYYERKGRGHYTDGIDELDTYITPVEAVECLLRLEGARLPSRLLDIGAGTGAITRPLRGSGRVVQACDIHDYGVDGVEGCAILDYLATDFRGVADGAIANPPYIQALAFAEKMVAEFAYAALIVRTSFYVEAAERDAFFAAHPPSRVWLASLRLPAMHRYRWAGRRVSDFTAKCWLVWVRGVAPSLPRRFNWKTILKETAS